MTIIVLIIALLAILGAAIFFTNAVEILGKRLNLGGGSVGSVLAAVGTALPETMIPLLAILGSLLASGDVGSNNAVSLGAIVGAPFLLATLGMFVDGIAAHGYRRRRQSGDTLSVDVSITRRDLFFFLVLFTVAGAAGLVELPLWGSVVLALVLVGAYVLHVRQTLKSAGGSEEDEEDKLLLWPSGRGEAPTWAVGVQVAAAITVMAIGAHYFVTSVEHLSAAIGIPAGLIALILAPLATELPEKFNSVFWLRESKDPIALGNITGAMVFQSAVPVSLGLIFTPWNLDFLSGLAVAFALVFGIALLTTLLRKRPLKARFLMSGGILYALFIVAAIITVIAGGT